MVWGTHTPRMASRPWPTLDQLPRLPEALLVRQPFPVRLRAQCEQCDAVVFLKDDGKLPASWAQVGPDIPGQRRALCPDCKPKRIRRSPQARRARHG